MIITGYEQLILYIADKTVQKPDSNKTAFAIPYFHYFLFLARKIREMTQDWTQACNFPHCPIMFSLITGTLLQQCIMKTTSKVSHVHILLLVKHNKICPPIPPGTKNKKMKKKRKLKIKPTFACLPKLLPHLYTSATESIIIYFLSEKA